jgi:hypothetical protein
MVANGAGFSRAVLFCAEAGRNDRGFLAQDHANRALDNDWLRLTGDDRCKSRAFEWEYCDA